MCCEVTPGPIRGRETGGRSRKVIGGFACCFCRPLDFEAQRSDVFDRRARDLAMTLQKRNSPSILCTIPVRSTMLREWDKHTRDGPASCTWFSIRQKQPQLQLQKVDPHAKLKSFPTLLALADD